MKMKFFTLTIVISVLAVPSSYSVTTEDDLIVGTKSGKLRGKLLLDGYEKPFRAFRGIPYAKSPTGDLRFRPPEPAEPWNGILDATSDGAECPQPVLMDSVNYEGDENCLFLNVYTPWVNIDVTKLLPVLVFIHGGGFYFGTGNSNIYGPEKFMEVDAVLVTLNYRLGVLGFMSTEDENAPGNYGMLDMVQALSWIQENIDSFGGDPNKVTIFGESAGGASVVYLMLSPLAKGLFHAAIAQSGTPLTGWSFQRTPLIWTKRVANQLDCPTQETSEIVQCLKQKPVNSILRATEKLHLAVMFPMFLSPVVDNRVGGFLQDDPLALLNEGKIANKVPFVAGVDRDEGIAFYILMVRAGIFKTNRQRFLDGEEFRTTFLPYFASAIEPEMPGAEDKIIKEYFSGKDLDDPRIFQEAFSELLGDTMFKLGADITLRSMARAGVPTYAYLYNHASPLGMVSSGVFGEPHGNFIGHADELSVQFDFHPVPRENKENVQDMRMSKLMDRLWRNFAQTRKPSFAGVASHSMLQWLPYYEGTPRYLELSLTPSMKQGFLSNRTQFWTEIVSQELKTYHSEACLKEGLPFVEIGRADVCP